MRKLTCLSMIVLILLITPKFTPAQTPRAGFVNIALNDLSSFSAGGKNWQVASLASAELEKPAAMALSKGAGILVYNSDGGGDAMLATNANLGDIELELDFMLARGTEARLYLQGRYGIQLDDSWAKQSVNISDCGAITERRKVGSEPSQGFEGLAPAMNVCRAPGLWQHLNLVFRSPRFDTGGQKTGNARFEEVYLNGVLVQSQVQLSGPSKQAIAADEKSTGPIVMHAVKGAVAFRNINYRAINPLQLNLANIRYKYYKGTFDERFPDISKLTLASQDTLSQLTWNTGKGDEQFAIEITGNLPLPATDDYTFSLMTAGLSRLYIDDKLVIERITNRWNQGFYRKQARLEAGVHAVRLIYVKNIAEVKGALALTVQGLNTDKAELHDKSSMPMIRLTDPVTVEPNNRTYLLRSFLNYGPKKLTHVISGGTPLHTNYSYDLKQGALIQVWRGDFLDVTNMWVQRGEPQLASPLGSLITLSDAPALAILAAANTPWPDSVAFDDLNNKGYTLDSVRSPSFRYVLYGASVADRISPTADGKSLQRELTVTNAPAGLFFRIAAADKIEAVTDGLYKVDSQSYYLRVDKRFKPVLRQAGNGSELILPVSSGSAVNYSITW